MATRWLSSSAAKLLRAGEKAQTREFWSQHATKGFDLAIAALLGGAPLVWGGRHEMGRLVFAAVILLGCLSWGIRWNTSRHPGPLRLSRCLWIPIAAALWLLMQLVPLPTFLADMLGSGSGARLPLWSGAESLAGLPAWSTISLVPSATLASLSVLVGYGLIFFLVLQWLTTVDDVQKLLRWISLACGFMALFGLLQHFTADGRFFWVYDHPFRDTSHVVCGSFINRNHFAHFVGVGIIASLSQLLLASSVPRPKTGLPSSSPTGQRRAMAWMVVIALSSLALLLSFSRGGVAACAVGLGVAVALAYWYRLWTGRQIFAISMAALLVGGVLALHRGDQLAGRLDTLGSGSLEELDRGGARRLIWEANLHAIGTYWLTGSGAGTHREVAPAFLSESRTKPYTHAENGYLQILTETGLVGGLLIVATFAFVANWTNTILRSTRSLAIIASTASLVGGLVLSAIHSLIDFVWYIPATMTLTLMMLAALCRLASLARETANSASDAAACVPAKETVHLPALDRSVRLQWGSGIVLVAVGMIAPLVKPALASSAWDRYLIYSTIQSAQHDLGGWGMPVDTHQANIEGEIDLLHAKIDALTTALTYNPHHYLAHVRLAQSYLQLFEIRALLRENQQGLSQIEATVAAAQFSSREEVNDWLRRAVGRDVALLEHARHHARQAVGLSPFDGTAYVCLAHVSMLDDPTGRLERAYLDQAARVRPQDGEVLFEHGKSLLMAGEVGRAIEAWQRAFYQPGPQRQMIIQVLGGRAPAAHFLETFKPDWTTLPALWQQYYAAQKPADLDTLLAYAKSQAEGYVRTPGNPASPHIWRALAGMYRDQGDGTGELRCLEAAMKENGSLYPIRHDLAIALSRQGKYREAQAHFRWCLAVHPENQAMRRSYQQALEAERNGRALLSQDPISTIAR